MTNANLMAFALSLALMPVQTVAAFAAPPARAFQSADHRSNVDAMREGEKRALKMRARELCHSHSDKPVGVQSYGPRMVAVARPTPRGRCIREQKRILEQAREELSPDAALR